MKNKHMIVTGGLGFIGSSLAEQLLPHNRVTVIDDGSTGSLDNLGDHHNLTLIKGSITDLDLGVIFQGHDNVVHLAAQTSVPASIKDPITSGRTNITGTLKVLIAARDAGVEKVVFASSAAVYGNDPALPKSEDMQVSPLSPYAVEKVAGEHYCRVFNELYGLNTAALRFFNVFGPKQDPDSQYAAVIPKFIDALFNGKTPVIYGDGEQSRDFIFIRHVLDAIILACESDATGVYNVASGGRTTVNQLFGIISGIMGKEGSPMYAEARTGEVRHSVADISKAEIFGYRPEVTLEKELRETVSWSVRKAGKKKLIY